MVKGHETSPTDRPDVQALKEFRRKRQELYASNATKEQIAAVLQASTKVMEQKVKALKRSDTIFVPQPSETGTPPDLAEIPQWRGRKIDGMPLDFIEKHYGSWLSAFGAEDDTVFMDQIRKHDRRLITGIENQLREEGHGRKVGQFIKPRSARTDRELAQLTVEDLHRVPRLASTLSSRQRRAQEANGIASSHAETRPRHSAHRAVTRKHAPT